MDGSPLWDCCSMLSVRQHIDNISGANDPAIRGGTQCDVRGGLGGTHDPAIRGGTQFDDVRGGSWWCT